MMHTFPGSPWITLILSQQYAAQNSNQSVVQDIVMNYIDYISGITFRFINPLTPVLPIGFDRFTQRLRLATLLELVNTRLPCREREMKRRLRRICDIPRMSTFAIASMINEGVSQMPDDHVFVNVGVWRGFTLLAGMVNNEHKRCVGVDNFSQFGGPRKAFLEKFNNYRSRNHCFFEMDYVEYFGHVHGEPIGFYMYDGDHDYENQLKGLQAAEPFFSESSIILVDDANYDEVRQATMDFVSHSSGKYRAVLDETTYCNCHPTFWNGIIILQRLD